MFSKSPTEYNWYIERENGSYLPNRVQMIFVPRKDSIGFVINLRLWGPVQSDVFVPNGIIATYAKDTHTEAENNYIAELIFRCEFPEVIEKYRLPVK